MALHLLKPAQLSSKWIKMWKMIGIKGDGGWAGIIVAHLALPDREKSFAHALKIPPNSSGESTFGQI